MDYINRFWARIRAVLVAMPPSQRASIVALLAVVAVSIVLLVTWGSKVEYTPVFTGLTGSDMASAQTALKDSQIDYKFADGMLLVRPADKDKVFMVLSEKDGLPADMSRKFSLEDLTKPRGFSMETAEEQSRKFNIAVQNRIALWIRSIPEVANADVLIASERDGFFGPEKATASVYIQPRTSDPIGKNKLGAIAKLTASAVGPKLSPKDVVVTNLVTGESFSLADENSAFARATNQMELQSAWDEHYSKVVEKFLFHALGQTHALVHTTVDSTTRSLTETTFEVVQERSNTSTTTGPAQPAGDTLTQPNVAASVTTAPAGAGSKSETEETEKTRAPSKQLATDTPPGEVTGISISVLADLARVEESIRVKEALAEDQTVDAARLQKEYEFWEDKLKTGLPVDAAAQITSVRFSAAPFQKADFAVSAAVAPPVSSRILDLLLANMHRIGLAVLALMALLMIRSIAKKAEIEAEVVKPEEKPEEEISLPELEIDMEQKRGAKMRESIEEMVRTDPQTAVSLIRRWMARES